VPTQHRDLLAVPDDEFQVVEGLEGVVARRCEKEVYGVARTIVVTRSENFLAKQLVGLAQTRGRAEVASPNLSVCAQPAATSWTARSCRPGWTRPWLPGG
jgi:hypothetical protein